jgi:hypothetical protein
MGMFSRSGAHVGRARGRTKRKNEDGQKTTKGNKNLGTRHSIIVPIVMFLSPSCPVFSQYQVNSRSEH